MPQGYTPPQTGTGSKAQLRQALGYVPPRAPIAALSGGVEIDPSSGEVGLADTAVTPGVYGDVGNVPILDIDAKGRVVGAANQAIPATTFGTGAPSTPGNTEGATYYDTTLGTYVSYVWHSAAWHLS